MGRDDRAIASIGISMRIKDAIDAINEENFTFMRDFIFGEESFVDDSNSFFTSTFRLIIDGCCRHKEMEHIVDVDELSCEEYKKYMTEMTKRFGGESGHFPLKEYEEDDKDNLYNQTLLVPHYELIETWRHGWHREGTNGTCGPLDIKQLSFCSEKMERKMKKRKIPEDKFIVCIVLSQHGG